MKKKQGDTLAKKKQDKKVMTGFSIVTGVIAVIFLVIGLVLDVANNIAADGILALFAVFLLFCVMGVIIVFVLKREIKYIEHPELQVEKEKKNADSTINRTKNTTKYRVNHYTDELEEDDGLSIEEIDFFESDIFDE